MKQLPDAKTYENEMSYIPYRESLRQVENFVVRQTPTNGHLLDLMCGPGFLLGKISERRGDLTLKGVDLDGDYVGYANKTYPEAEFEVGDVLSWEPKQKFDAVICTGALHHVPYERQADVIERMSKMVRDDGFVLISDCYIDDHSNETQRKLAAAKLGYEYILEAIKTGDPRDILEATADILCNDVVMDEFKTSIAQRTQQFYRIFRRSETHKKWPTDIHYGSYGDYITVLRGRND